MRISDDASCKNCGGAKYVVVGMHGVDDAGRLRPPTNFVAYACDDINDAIQKAASIGGAIFEFVDGELELNSPADG